MKIYHGSKQILSNPIIKGSKEDNDYGPAFYMTRDLESAHEWACRNNSIGYVNEYTMRLDGLKILDLRDKNKWSILHWISILLHFRYLDPGFVKAFSFRLKYLEENYYINVDEYDVIIGFRADDAYFRFPLDFVRGNITLSQLEYAYFLGDLGTQYVLISERAIKRLKYVKSFLSEEKYINRYFENVRKSTEAFDNLNKGEEGIRISKIMEGDKL